MTNHGDDEESKFLFCIQGALAKWEQGSKELLKFTSELYGETVVAITSAALML